jgi:hypothetical protein
MTTRRNLIAGAALLAPLALTLKTAQATEHKDKEGEAHAKPQFLFVQSAEGVAYADGRLTLKGISPITVLFSDRPERLAGHMATENFIPFWGEGADSFKSDPPNGTLSVLEGGAMDNVVMTLRNPQLAGRDPSYEVVVLEGKPPASGGAASLFIDIIGMPLTPVSFAGARRRVWRRSFYR